MSRVQEITALKNDVPEPTAREIENTTIREAVELYLSVEGMAASRFGRKLAKDPALVTNLRQGRVLGNKLSTRLRKFLVKNGYLERVT